MNIFKASEILKIAIQIEKNGLAFYNGIKERTKNFTTQEVFGFLAKEEEKHKKTFEQLLEDVGDYQPVQSYPGEYELYLEALASENIFRKEADLKKIAKDINSDSQAIDMGIGFEKDSIIFYGEMKNFVPKEEGAIVDDVLLEEKEHLLKLFGLKKQGF
ncbi:MAG: ferritin family protein [Candidatus Omnitrophota bacterium]|nr:ferritin family protein [Candidatus Omnitrophota bacterium]